MKDNLIRKISRSHNSGFTLFELLTVLAIFAIIATLVVPQFLNMRKNAALRILEVNQRVLQNIIVEYNIFDRTPQETADGDTVTGGIRVLLRDAMQDSLERVVNPFSKCENIISTSQAQSSDSAAIVIQAGTSQTMQQAINSIHFQTQRLWPLSSTSESYKRKFVGAIIIRICSDGYLIYAYPAYEEVHNIIEVPYSQLTP